MKHSFLWFVFNVLKTSNICILPIHNCFSSVFKSLSIWGNVCLCMWTSLVAQMVKHLPTMWETQVRSLGWEDPLEKEMVTHSSTLSRIIPWTEEYCRLQPWGRKESDTAERLLFSSFCLCIIDFKDFFIFSYFGYESFFFSLFFFGWTAYIIIVPWKGIKPTPLKWKCRILTTGLPGKSPLFNFFHK